MKLTMFKAKVSTRRFKQNQKVFISSDEGNYFRIKFKYRASGRWVNGILNKWNSSYSGLNKAISVLKEIDVEEEFYNFITK